MRRAWFAILALTHALAAPVLAQRADSARTARDSTPPAFRLPPVVVTGTVAPTRPAELGFALTVVDSATLTRSQPRVAADVLREVPGAYVEQAAGPNGPTIVRLRGGEEIFTQILMDGVQFNQNGGFFDFAGFPLTNVERIEIARGPQSVIYGSSAVSGVVNLITREGRAGPPRWQLTTEAGAPVGALPSSNVRGAALQSELTAGGGSSGLRYSLGIGTTYGRGVFALPSAEFTRDLSARLDATPSHRWEVSSAWRAIAIDVKRPVRDPGATRVPLDPNARESRDRAAASLQATFHATPGWTQRVRFSAFREAFVFEDRFDDVASTGTYGFGVFDANFLLDSHLWRTMIGYSSSHQQRIANGSSLRLSYGGEWQRESLTDSTAGDFGAGTLPLARHNVAGYAELHVTAADRLTLLAGTRIDKYAKLSSEFTPRAAAVITILPGTWRLRAAGGRAYKAPNLQQQYLDNPFIAPNPGLGPETSTSWEIGSNLTLLAGRLSVEAGYFRQDFDGLIQLVPFDTSGRLVYRNLSKTAASGIEWTTRLLPAPSWDLRVDGAWLQTEILDNTGLDPQQFPQGAALPFRPNVVISGQVGHQPTHYLHVLLRGRYLGRQTVLTERFSGSRVELRHGAMGTRPDVAIFDLLASVRPSAWIEVYGRVENLFDAQYQTAFDRPGLPLTAVVGLRLTN